MKVDIDLLCAFAFARIKTIAQYIWVKNVGYLAVMVMVMAELDTQFDFLWKV